VPNPLEIQLMVDFWGKSDIRVSGMYSCRQSGALP
jgi:hypothetical protein